MMSKGQERLAHIFAQPDNHQEAIIIANRNGLIELKRAIEETLEKGEGSCILMPSDGENFRCEIRMNNEDWESPFWQRLKVPYSELLDTDENLIEPFMYVDCGLKQSEDIPRVEKIIAENERINKELTEKFNKRLIELQEKEKKEGK